MTLTTPTAATTLCGEPSLKTFLDKPVSALSFRGQGDFCLSFFAVAYEHGWIEFPEAATVLEIGCAEGDWMTPMKAIRPDLDLLGIDVRECQRPGAVLKGDVLTWSFLDRSFDAIVSISAIEHIGLGGYGDPEDPDGDIKTLQKAHAWLKPGGWMYLDVPYQEHGPMVVESNWRRYSDDAIDDRLAQGLFTIEKRAKCIVEHPDSPYMALLLRKV